ncbi:MAG: hypothetical protein PVI26_04125 [Chitinispirillia bacterium]|jgi:hypothetical protein
MEKELKIGILAPNFALLEIIDQIGITFEIISTFDTVSITKFSLIIINRPIIKKEIILIKDYISNGGAILDFGHCIDRIINGTLKKQGITYILPKDIPFIPILNYIDIYGSILSFSKAQYLNKSLFIDSYGQGLIAFLGMDINSLFLKFKTKRKEFYADTPRFPNEEVSLVSKGEIILLIFYILKHLHCKRNLPFIHKWFFPNRAKNVFLFRVDSDYGSKKQIQQWFELSQIYKIKYTWFLHTEAHKEWLPYFTEFKNHEHEMAIHGYKHFFSKFSNEKNIEDAYYLMKKNGLFGQGYASPYGLWNEKLNSTCEKFGFLYSSEFSYIYDSIPIRPIFSNRISRVLQIPVHPICIGSLINAKIKDKEIAKYYSAIFEKKLMNYSPLIFYDHVLHHVPSILKHLFEKVSQYSIPSLTFLEYATWWNKRLKIRYTATVNEHGNINVNLLKDDKEIFLCVWINDSEFFLTNKNGPLKKSMQKIERQIRYTPEIIPEKLQLTRKFNPRLFKLSLLNKYFRRNYQ